MMHRVFGHLDVIMLHQNEVHLPAVGVSNWSLLGWGLGNQLGRWTHWKVNANIHMGISFFPTNPMGLGHDAGPGRVHCLVMPDPTGLKIIAANATAFANSSEKPMFTAHSVQIKVADSMLPICCQMIPKNLGIGSSLHCSTVSMPNAFPIVPTQLSVYTGLTWGDFFGGLVNIVIAQITSAAKGLIDQGIGQGIENALGCLASKVIPQILGGLIGTGQGFADTQWSTGPTNWGSFVQQWIDRDHVTSDADISGTTFGFGWRIPQESGTGHPPPSLADAEFCSPWSS